MRWQEMQAVFGAINHSAFSLLFGNGWGAQYASPAVAGDIVNFTHNFFSGLLLKAGLVGVCLSLFYFGMLIRGLGSLSKRAPVFVLAISGPLLINLFLYASYKSLDFGLILFLVVLWTFRTEEIRESLQENPASGNSVTSKRKTEIAR